MSFVRHHSVLIRHGAAVLQIAALLHIVADSSQAGEAETSRIVAAPLHSEAEVRRAINLWRRSAPDQGSIAILDPLLASRVQSLRQTSQTFARGWDDLVRSGMPIVIGNHEQLQKIMPAHVRNGDGWAGLTLNWGNGGGRLVRSAIVIRVEWVERLHLAYGNPREAVLDALDELLIHEIYGHLVPVVAAANTRASCPDPAHGERFVDSCVGKRAMAIRSELTANPIFTSDAVVATRSD